MFNHVNSVAAVDLEWIFEIEQVKIESHTLSGDWRHDVDNTRPSP